MQELENFKGIDIYLLDQMMKGNLNLNQRILDAGCGGARNIHYLLNLGANITAIDPNEEAIRINQKLHPIQKDRFIQSSIEQFTDEEGFNFIICNAVLHFAQSHSQFNTMFNSLVKLLKPNGILFIRTTSNIGISTQRKTTEDGVFYLKDESFRYLITKKQITDLCSHHNLILIEPIKSSVVNELRSMTTLVLSKK